MMMRTQNTSNKVQRILQMMRNIQAHLCRKYDKKDVLTVDKSSKTRNKNKSNAKTKRA